MPTRYGLQLAGTVALAATCVSFAALAFVGLLSYTQPSRYDVLESAANSTLWGWIFGVVGAALGVALLLGPGHHNVAAARLSSMAASFMGVWAFFTLLWGLTSEHPVSLAAPALAVFTVVGAQVLAVSWNRKE